MRIKEDLWVDIWIVTDCTPDSDQDEDATAKGHAVTSIHR